MRPWHHVLKYHDPSGEVVFLIFFTTLSRDLLNKLPLGLSIRFVVGCTRLSIVVYADVESPLTPLPDGSFMEQI